MRTARKLGGDMQTGAASATGHDPLAAKKRSAAAFSSYFATRGTLLHEPNPLMGLGRFDLRGAGKPEKDGVYVSYSLFRGLAPPHGMYSVEMLAMMLADFDSLDNSQRARVVSLAAETAGGMAPFMRLLHALNEKRKQQGMPRLDARSGFDFAPFCEGVL